MKSLPTKKTKTKNQLGKIGRLRRSFRGPNLRPGGGKWETRVHVPKVRISEVEH
jgi:hypothetical protein